MIFFNKPKKVTVDFFTHEEAVYMSSQPVKAMKQVPNWWKDLPRKHGVNEYLNMQTCPGFVSLYANSFILPMWCDTIADIGITGPDDWRVHMPDPTFKANNHPAEQFNYFFPQDKFQHIKLINPWVAKANTETQFMLHDVHWDRTSQNDFFVLPGVTDYMYQHTLNINTIFMRGPDVRSTTIKAGQPLAFMTPLTEREVDLKCHLVTEQEYYKLTPVKVAYRSNLQKITAFAQRRKSK